MKTNELYHYGVKGMKWGVRRYRKQGGDLVLPKGTTVKRVSNNVKDKTYDNKKYVSINQKDHSKWETYLGKAYIRRNQVTWNQTYATTKDLRVMSSKKQGELFTKMMLEDKKFKNQALKDIEYSDYALAQKTVKNAAENISRNIAIQTKTGKAFVKRVIVENYDAIEDTHGKNVSKSPLIILNPDANIERVSDPEYTNPVKKYASRRRY